AEGFASGGGERIGAADFGNCADVVCRWVAGGVSIAYKGSAGTEVFCMCVFADRLGLLVERGRPAVGQGWRCRARGRSNRRVRREEPGAKAPLFLCGRLSVGLKPDATPNMAGVSSLSLSA